MAKGETYYCPKCRKDLPGTYFPPSTPRAPKGKNYCTLCMRSYKAERRRLGKAKAVVAPLSEEDRKGLWVLGYMAQFRCRGTPPYPRPEEVIDHFGSDVSETVSTLIDRGCLEPAGRAAGSVRLSRKGYSLLKNLTSRSSQGGVK